MNNKDLARLEELLRESESKSREIRHFDSILDEELKSMIGKWLGNADADLNYSLKRLLITFEEIKNHERAYLNSISIYNSRVNDALASFE